MEVDSRGTWLEPGLVGALPAPALMDSEMIARLTAKPGPVHLKGCGTWPGQRRESVIVTWDINCRGREVPLDLMAKSKEDHDTFSASFQDMRNRSLSEPLLCGLGHLHWPRTGT